MNSRRVRLGDTLDAIAGPLARLNRSLREDREAVLKAEQDKSGHDLLATDAFLQRFQQTTDLVLRKLFPRLLAVLEESDMRHPFRRSPVAGAQRIAEPADTRTCDDCG